MGEHPPSFTCQTLQQSRPQLIHPKPITGAARAARDFRPAQPGEVGARTPARQRLPLAGDGPPPCLRIQPMEGRGSAGTNGKEARRRGLAVASLGGAERAAGHVAGAAAAGRPGSVRSELGGHAAGSSLRLRRAGMLNLAALLWRRLLRKRWVLALVFGLSLVYFLSSTFKQVSDCARDLCPSDPSSFSSQLLPQILDLPPPDLLLPIFHPPVVLLSPIPQLSFLPPPIGPPPSDL